MKNKTFVLLIFILVVVLVFSNNQNRHYSGAFTISEYYPGQARYSVGNEFYSFALYQHKLREPVKTCFQKCWRAFEVCKYEHPKNIGCYYTHNLCDENCIRRLK